MIKDARKIYDVIKKINKGADEIKKVADSAGVKNEKVNSIYETKNKLLQNVEAVDKFLKSEGS